MPCVSVISPRATARASRTFALGEVVSSSMNKGHTALQKPHFMQADTSLSSFSRRLI
jgi:uncharacterized protein (DUF697 family)